MVAEESPVQVLDLNRNIPRVFPDHAVRIEAHVLPEGAPMLTELYPEDATILRRGSMTEPLSDAG